MVHLGSLTRWTKPIGFRVNTGGLFWLIGSKDLDRHDDEIILREVGLIEKRVNPSEFYRIFEGQ